jgi:predicted nuclease with TOPRIM domain
MMRAMSEKLQEEKECVNIQLTNLFLKGFLKHKMERIIAENSEVEHAYHQIRSNTDVRDSKELIHRFLNRERGYGALLDTIAEKEHFLEGLKAEREVLDGDQHQLTQRAEELQEGAAKEATGFPALQKQLEALEATLKDIKYKKDLMRKWATRFHSAFTGSHQQGRPFKELLLEVLGEISKYTEHLLGD